MFQMQEESLEEVVVLLEVAVQEAVAQEAAAQDPVDQDLVVVEVRVHQVADQVEVAEALEQLGQRL